MNTIETNETKRNARTHLDGGITLSFCMFSVIIARAKQFHRLSVTLSSSPVAIPQPLLNRNILRLLLTELQWPSKC